MAEGIDNHPLANEKIPSDRHGRRQHNICDYADKESITKGISHIFFKKSHVIFVVGPLSEVIKGSVKEAIHDDQQNWEILLVKKSDDNEQQIHWCVIDHLKDEGLNEVAHLYEDVILLPLVQLRHCARMLLRLPNNYLHCLLRHIHVVKDQIAISEKQ